MKLGPAAVLFPGILEALQRLFYIIIPGEYMTPGAFTTERIR
jgi:hypothetical protein